MTVETLHDLAALRARADLLKWDESIPSQAHAFIARQQAALDAYAGEVERLKKQRVDLVASLAEMLDEVRNEGDAQ